MGWGGDDGVVVCVMAVPFLHQQNAVVRKECPTYGRRKGWIPRSLDDYGDGGAFPEVHIAQYPLNMGKKKGGVVCLVVVVLCFLINAHPYSTARLRRQWFHYNWMPLGR